MFKPLLYITFLLAVFTTTLAQIDENALVSLPRATTTELNAITTPQLGSLAYDTDKNRVVQYTNAGWSDFLTARNVYVGAFTINAAGNQDITGLPFQPSQITFVAHANVESLNINSDNGTGNNDRGIPNSFGTMNGFARDDSGTIVQQVIYVGGHGNSINDITRYASSSNCIGLRYGDQNGNSLGRITASLSSFNTDGFTVNVTYTNGTVTANNGNPIVDVQPDDVLGEGIVVLFTAYR
ncbi:conserved exported hypothetical protein [Tenacibaculum litopenaei]|uniref:hypothetical protein n=1 Tax=Tenacibaculum litopenaei TaxID=396016 RepID=UPI003895CD5D